MEEKRRRNTKKQVQIKLSVCGFVLRYRAWRVHLGKMVTPLFGAGQRIVCVPESSGIFFRAWVFVFSRPPSASRFVTLQDLTIQHAWCP